MMSNNKTIRWLDKIRTMEKVALVTGSSSGIGYETSLSLAREGYFTYATMRDLKKAGTKLEKAEKLEVKIMKEEEALAYINK